MMDETIEPRLYRTAVGDRGIPLSIAAVLAAAAPLLAWGSGALWFPWGTAAALACAAGAAGAFLRWRKAREVVVWNGEKKRLEFRRGRFLRILEWDRISKIEVRPSAVRTLLWDGSVRCDLSHRLVGAEGLLDRLRALRPELFERPGPLVLRRSSAAALLQAGLAAGTAATGFVLAEWQPAMAVFFFTAAAYVFLRILFFIPRLYRVEEGALTTLYWLRKKRWGRPLFLREESYAAGGAVFFRLIFDYGRWKVPLDEEHLLDPLRPDAPRIAAWMGNPG